MSKEQIEPTVSKTAHVTVPVFTFVINKADEVYLQRRFNTGYRDGHYEPPAGKLDLGEFPVQAACRETKEESGIIVIEKDLELFHTYTNLSNNQPWLGLFFRTRTWLGTPEICEPYKCDDAGWFSVDDPPLLAPQVSDAIGKVLTAHTIDMSNYQSA